MTKDSDVIIFIPGTLLCQVEGFVLFHSLDTGDYVTPDDVPSVCLISARRRLDGFLEHEDQKVLENSKLHEHPPEFYVATGEVCDEEPLPSTWRAKRRRQSTPPQKARGSADPPPQDNSSRGSGAASPRIRLTEAPWHKQKLVSPPQSPRGSRNWSSKTQGGAVSGSTREAEIPDYDPDSLAKDNKKSKMPRPPTDEPPDKEDDAGNSALGNMFHEGSNADMLWAPASTDKDKEFQPDCRPCA